MQERDNLRENLQMEELLNQQLSAKNSNLSAQLKAVKSELVEYSHLKNPKAEIAELKIE
jgi:hypothetical protein